MLCSLLYFGFLLIVYFKRALDQNQFSDLGVIPAPVGAGCLVFLEGRQSCPEPQPGQGGLHRFVLKSGEWRCDLHILSRWIARRIRTNVYSLTATAVPKSQRFPLICFPSPQFCLFQMSRPENRRTSSLWILSSSLRLLPPDPATVPGTLLVPLEIGWLQGRQLDEPTGALSCRAGSTVERGWSGGLSSSRGVDVAVGGGRPHGVGVRGGSSRVRLAAGGRDPGRGNGPIAP